MTQASLSETRRAIGKKGDQGNKGDPGDPGDVSTGQMNDAIDAAIAGTSANTNGIGTLDSPFGDPDAEALRQKLNELILNGRR